jgi:alcohol dehydrogenase class IV
VPSPRQYGIDRDAYFGLIPTMVEQAIASGSPANNARLATPQEIAALYQEVYE